MSHFFLSYPVAEERREHDGRAYDEQAGTDHHHDFPCDAFLPRVHLDVNLQAGVNGHDGGNGIEQVEDIQHHGYHVVMHECQRVRAPAVVHSAAFGRSGQDRTRANQQPRQPAHLTTHSS